MNWEYIRGLFDGDGSAYVSVVTNARNGLRGRYVFCSNSKEFLDNVRSFIDDNLGTNGKIYMYDGRCGQLTYFRKEDTILIGLELLAGYLHKRDAVEKVMVANEWSDDFSSVVNDITVDYICGFFDADGGVFCSARGTVVVAFYNKRLQILTDIKEFFNMRNKICTLANTNKEPDYVLSTIAKEKAIEILEALRNGCVYKYDGIVEGLFWLNKIYSRNWKHWIDSDLKILSDNTMLSVWELSAILDKSPTAISCKRRAGDELDF